MKSYKVAFYISSLAKGGAQRVIINLAEHLIRQGIEVIIVTTKVEKEEYNLPDGVKRIISEIVAKESGNRIQNLFRRVHKLRTIWRQEKPSIIISFVGKNNFMAIFSSVFFDVKTIVSVRGEPNAEYYTPIMKLFAKSIMGLADGLILQTRQAKEFFPKWIQRKSMILPNPLTPEFTIASVHKKREIHTIVSIGRIDQNKNHKLLIDAFERIEKRYPDLKLIVYGDGELRESILQSIAGNDYEEKIQFPGLSSDVLTDLQNADLFILSSNTEGMPNALMEAMSLGLPVISTDCPCGGPAELIQNHVNGLLVPVGDVKAMEDAIIELLNDQNLTNYISDNALKIRTTHSPEVVNCQWMEYIQRHLR